jgi:hypothetical protein
MVSLTTSGALNIMTMYFMLKEKSYCFAEMPLLLTRDIRDWLCSSLSGKQSEQAMFQMIITSYVRRQRDINYAYSKEYANLSK